MSNIRQLLTGLKMVVWVFVRGSAKHGPRIKVSPTHSHKIQPEGLVTVSIEDVPRVIRGKLEEQDFEEVSRWIKTNRKLLLDYWDCEISTDELVAGIRRI